MKDKGQQPVINFSISSLMSQQQSSKPTQFSFFQQQPSSLGLPGSEQQANLQDVVHLFDPKECTWQEQKCHGKVPAKRVFHEAWYEAPYLFLYGGRSADKKILNDLYVLNVETF